MVLCCHVNDIDYCLLFFFSPCKSIRAHNGVQNINVHYKILYRNKCDDDGDDNDDDDETTAAAIYDKLL